MLIRRWLQDNAAFVIYSHSLRKNQNQVTWVLLHAELSRRHVFVVEMVFDLASNRAGESPQFRPWNKKQRDRENRILISISVLVLRALT